MQAVPATDADLIERVRRGEPEGAAGLFERYSAQLLRFAGRMLYDRADAEEVTQEVFLKVIASAQQYDGRAAVSSWLYAITANACRDRLRRLRRSTLVPLDSVAEPMREDRHEDRMVEAERRRAVRLALGRLSEEQREVLVLARYHDMPYVEIARTLSISEGAVKTRVFRAVEKLKEIFREDQSCTAAKP